MLVSGNLQSFDILTSILNSYEGIGEGNIDFLTVLAHRNDVHFECTDFSDLLKSKGLQSSQNNALEDRLFLNIDNPLLADGVFSLLSMKDRILSYTCIVGWLNETSEKLIEYSLLQRCLQISPEDSDAINYFYNSKNQEFCWELNEIFLLEPSLATEEELEGLWIENNMPDKSRTQSHLMFDNLNRTLKVLYIDKLRIFLITCPNCNLLLKRNNKLSLCRWELLEPGDTILIDNIALITYQDLKSRFLMKKSGDKLFMSVKSLEFSYPNGKGIKKFSYEIKPGSLVGIVGKEGAGKTTLLKLLAGELSSYSGDIIINGYDLRNHLYHLKGIIGYVPEEDLLYGELTVFENLHLSALLYLGKTPKDQVQVRITNLLKELELDQVAEIVVGSFRDKKLQPGQRRLLNIALELIRDPLILFVDNSISPLSLSDSAKIIEVLAKYTFKGKIVITSIAQVSTRLSSYFDSVLVIDESGYPVYSGNIQHAIEYFQNLLGNKKYLQYATKVNSEYLLELINTPQLLDGLTQRRFLSPSHLYELFFENTSASVSSSIKKILPENILNPPTLDRQYVIFNIRNFKTKIARSKELTFSLLAAPLISLLLGLIFRESTGSEYSYSLNENIPYYFFLSTILAVFLGLVQSVNEIYKEKSINKKQEYLNLSRFSYLNSKITYLFIIAVIQSFLFVLIANTILKIPDLFVLEWIIFFGSMAFGILFGLILSATQSGPETSYTRAIPIVILFQILFGGGFISFTNINLSKHNFTPFVADLSVSRWGYEALMVYAFKENKYERQFFDLDRKISQGTFNSEHLLPVLKSQLLYCNQYFKTNADTTSLLLKSLAKCLHHLYVNNEIFQYENIEKLNSNEFSETLSNDAMDYLEYLDLSFYTQYEQAIEKKKKLSNQIIDSLGRNALDEIKRKHYNNAIAEKVKINSPETIKYNSGSPLQVTEPIFQYPMSDFGRALLYIPEKQFNGEILSTTEFNISIIWLMNLFLYILLLSDIITKIKRRPL